MFEHLVKICVDFYREEDTVNAKAELDSVLETLMRLNVMHNTREFPGRHSLSVTVYGTVSE